MLILKWWCNCYVCITSRKSRRGPPKKNTSMKCLKTRQACKLLTSLGHYTTESGSKVFIPIDVAVLVCFKD